MFADFCFFFGSLQYITRLTDSFNGKRKTEICVQSQDLDDQNGVIGFRHFASSNVAVRLTSVQAYRSGLADQCSSRARARKLASIFLSFLQEYSTLDSKPLLICRN